LTEEAGGPGAGFEQEGQMKSGILSLAYLAWSCFADARDVDRNPQTFEFAAKKRSLIHRADGMSIGVESA
jgi:hypothetical protein